MNDESTQSRKQKSVEAIAPLLAGLSGGIVSTVLLYPLDLIKVRLQVNEDHLSHVPGANHSRRLTARQAVRGIIRHEGFLGLYQGLTPAVAGNALSWGGYFFIYEGMKRNYAQYKYESKESNQPFTSWESFVMACISGACMVGLTNPIWLIKTRMQLQMKRTAQERNMKPPYRSTAHAFTTILREEGPMALYKGAGPALMLVSHGGIQFVVYEFLKRHFHLSRAEHIPQQPVTERLNLSAGYLTMGAISKIVASTATYPLQVIKSRLQQRSESLELTSTGDVRVVKRQYRGFLGATRRILKKEGILGFFKGCIPSTIRVAPGAAVTFVVYETVMDMLGQ